MIPQQAQDIVQRVFEPLALDAFLRDTFGKTFLKSEGRADLAGRIELLGPDPRRTILDAFERLAPKITSHAAAPSGPPPITEAVPNAAAFKAKVDDFHARGYTVRIPEIQSLTPALEQFIRALELLFHQPVSVVAFWSRGDARAPIHHDNYDLIAVQILGRKKWFVSSDPSPLPNDWSVIPDGPARLDRYTEIDVGPGDLLYLPRGTTHRVDALAESIHVSVGFVPLTVREAIGACLDYLSDRDVTLRQTAGNFLDERVLASDFDNIRARIRDGIAALSKSAAGDSLISSALQHRSSKVLGKLSKLKPTSDETPRDVSVRVQHTPLAVCLLSGNDRLIDFAYPGGHHFIHRGAEESVAFIARTPVFRISDIPGAIGNDVRLALVGKFMDSGFLEIVET